MNVRLEFKSTPYLDVRSISVVASFNGYKEDVHPMIKSEGFWYIELLLPPGEHYYKYFINNEIKLNDPSANMYLPHKEDELWSAIIINNKGQRLFNNEQYSVHIDSYAMSGSVTSSSVAVSKKSYNLIMDKMVVVRFGFTQINGLHAVTAIWYNSYGQLQDCSENMLYKDESSPDNPVFLWFWLPLDDNQLTYSEGLWSVKLFINGSYVLEDQFMLTSGYTYSSRGQLYGSV